MAKQGSDLLCFAYASASDLSFPLAHLRDTLQVIFEDHVAPGFLLVAAVPTRVEEHMIRAVHLGVEEVIAERARSGI
jgi:hypothetical protein